MRYLHSKLLHQNNQIPTEVAKMWNRVVQTKTLASTVFG